MAFEKVEERTLLTGSTIAAADIASMTSDQVVQALQTLIVQKDNDQQQLTDLASQIDAAKSALQTAANHAAAADSALSDLSTQLIRDQEHIDNDTSFVSQKQDALQSVDKALATLTQHQHSFENEIHGLKDEIDLQKKVLLRVSPYSNQYRDAAKSISYKQQQYSHLVQANQGVIKTLITATHTDTDATHGLQLAQLTLADDQHALESDTVQIHTLQDDDTAAHTDYDAQKRTTDALMQTQTDVQNDLDDVVHIIALAQARQNELQQEQEAALLKQQQDEAAALAGSLTDTVTTVLDQEAHAIGYPKMYVSVEQLSTGDTRLHVRYRNPGQCTFVNMHIDGGGYGEVVATQPTADGMADITLRPGDGESGPFTICLNDGTTGQTLAQVQGIYDRFGKIAQINTPQNDFSYDEPGRMEVDPIKTDFKIAEISGPNVLIAGATSCDSFYMACNTGGILSTATIDTPGGCTFATGRLTVDTNRPTGDYAIHFFDKPLGMEIAPAIMLHLDHDSHTVSLVNQNDAYTGNPDDPSDQESFDTMNKALQSVPLIENDIQIAAIENTNLYQYTDSLQAPYRFYWSAQRMLDAFYATPQYQKYSASNIDATIQKRWDDMGTYDDHGVTRHLYAYSVASDEIIGERDSLVKQYTDALGDYEKVMGDTMHAAVDIYLGVMQGKAEQLLRDTLHTAWLFGSTYKGVPILANIGIQYPSERDIIDAGKIVFQMHWEYLVQVDSDVAAYRHYSDVQREHGEMLNAQGEWVAISNTPATELPPEMDTNQIRLAVKIDAALKRLYGDSVDVLDTSVKNKISIAVASAHTSSDADVQNAVTSVLVSSATSNTPLFNPTAMYNYIHTILSAPENSQTLQSVTVQTQKMTTDTNAAKDAITDALNQPVFDPDTLQIEGLSTDLYTGSSIEDPQAIYKRAYQALADLLTLVQKTFDDKIAALQYEIDWESQKLLTDTSLNILQKAELGVGILTAQNQKMRAELIKALIPATPAELAIDVALSAVGGPALSKASTVLKLALGKFDELAGTQLLAQFSSRISILESETANLNKAIKDTQGAVKGEMIGMIEITTLENEIGHACEEHIGKTNDYLAQRIAQGLPEASTFINYDLAAKTIIASIKDNATDMAAWAKDAAAGTKKGFRYNGTEMVGRIMNADKTIQTATDAMIVMVANGKGGYDLLTAYLLK